MKAWFYALGRGIRSLLAILGLLALLLGAVQFSPLPWRAYKSLSRVGDPFSDPPTHILVMGGSGIPGDSGLMRTFYAARVALRNPAAEVLVALPYEETQSAASRAYLDELELRGISRDRLRIIAGGNNTHEQALRLTEYLAPWTDEAPRVLIVTSPEHVRRTVACIRHSCQVNLAAFPRRQARLRPQPAHPLSIEDPPLRLPGEQEAATPASAAPASGTASSPGAAFLRYNVWNNLSYTGKALREYVALLYYRLRGWI